MTAVHQPATHLDSVAMEALRALEGTDTNVILPKSNTNKAEARVATKSFSRTRAVNHRGWLARLTMGCAMLSPLNPSFGAQPHAARSEAERTLLAAARSESKRDACSA